MSKYLSTEPLSEVDPTKTRKKFPDIFYTKTNEKGYEVVTYPLCSRNTDIKFKGQVLKDKDLWFGQLLDDPIIIKSMEYPAFARYCGSETDFINPNNYNTRIITSIDDIDVISDSGISKPLPQQCDHTKSKDLVKEEIKAAKIKRKTTIVIPVLINIYDEDEATLKVAFFSQDLSYYTMKELNSKNVIPAASEVELCDYLFGEFPVLGKNPTLKIGGNIVLFQNTNAPIKQQGAGNWNWTGTSYTTLFDSLNDKTKSRYFNLENPNIPRKYLQYFASLNCASLMSDSKKFKGTGLVMKEDNTVDEEASSLNALYQRYLRGQLWEHNPFRKKQDSQPTVVNNDPTFDEIPF